ncbi:hypothetical protein ACWEOW_14625 [Monashia sp. NPDC004114]
MPAQPRRTVAALLATLAAAALLGGCGQQDDWSGPHDGPTAIGSLGPGFVDPSAPPSPEATISPEPGSWDGVRPAPGYRVVLLRAGTDAPTATTAKAVTDWAQQQDVSLKTITATSADHYIGSITGALDLAPDLVICVGNDLLDALALVTANHLDQQFLVVGAELAEPTANVTAANWTGASFRGEGLHMATSFDPATFTPERVSRAVRAGVAAVLHGRTGIVIRVS